MKILLGRGNREQVFLILRVHVCINNSLKVFVLTFVYFIFYEFSNVVYKWVICASKWRKGNAIDDNEVLL